MLTLLFGIRLSLKEIQSHSTKQNALGQSIHLEKSIQACHALDMNKNMTQKLGGLFAIIAWIIFLVMASLFMHRWFEEPDEPISEVLKVERTSSRSVPRHRSVRRVKQVTIRANRRHHYVVKGKINGKAVRFLVDTGASNVSIPGSVAKKLKLPHQSILNASTANGTVKVWGTTIPSLRIGNIHLRNIKANINPYLKGKDILLGMSALKELEFRHNKGYLILIQH